MKNEFYFYQNMITFSLDLNNGLTSLNCETAGKDHFLQALTEFSTKLYDTNHILSAAYCVEKKGIDINF